MIDSEWFAQNPTKNFRLRLPKVGEVDELARLNFPREFGALGHVFPPPVGCDWWICAIAAGDAVARMLCSRDVGAALMPAAQRNIYAVALGERVAVSTGDP